MVYDFQEEEIERNVNYKAVYCIAVWIELAPEQKTSLNQLSSVFL